MRAPTYLSRLAHVAVVLSLFAACGGLTGPAGVEGLSIEVQFPNDERDAREKRASLDTASLITRMELIVTTRQGDLVLRRPFTSRENGWQIEAALAPARDLRVRVDAWHYDALMYSGVDSGVTVEPGTVTTARVLLESYRPSARITVQLSASGPYAVYVDPRGSSDRTSAGEELRVRYDWENDGAWDTDYISLITQVHNYPAPGPYTVSAAVINQAGLITGARAEFVLPLKAQPLTPSLIVTPAEGDPGAQFIADATRSVPGLSRGDSASFRWDWNGDGAWDSPWTASPLAQAYLAETGTYRVRVEIRASEGRKATAEASATVRSVGIKPVASLALYPVNAGPGERIVADAGRSQTGGAQGPLQFRWDWEGDGRWDTDWTAESMASTSFATPGTRFVQGEVRNSAGQSDTARGQVVVSSTQSLVAGQELVVDGVSMRYVPGGRFSMGNKNMSADEFPVHVRDVKAFLMDTYEVTNAEYQRFITATGYQAPAHWIGGRYPAGQGTLPVVNVSWSDAAAYAAWHGCRLPTEDEWEYAARGTDGRLFPWGSFFEPGRANWDQSPIRPVGEFPRGASPFGVQDMAGNVREWTADLYRPYPGFGNYILVPPGTQGSFDETRYLVSGNPFLAQFAAYRVTRGGSVGADLGTNGIELRSTNRDPHSPAEGARNLGFRCVRDLP